MILYPKDVMKSEFGNPAEERHLPALKSETDFPFPPGTLSLVPSAGGAALTGTETAAETLRVAHGAFGGPPITRMHKPWRGSGICHNMRAPSL